MEAQDLPTITSFTNMSALIAWPFIADILGRIPVIPGPPPPPLPPRDLRPPDPRLPGGEGEPVDARSLNGELAGVEVHLARGGFHVTPSVGDRHLHKTGDW